MWIFEELPFLVAEGPPLDLVPSMLLVLLHRAGPFPKVLEARLEIARFGRFPEDVGPLQRDVAAALSSTTEDRLSRPPPYLG